MSHRHDPTVEPFPIKKGALAPVYEVTLYDKFNTPGQKPLDLTLATAVRMKMRRRGATTLTVDSNMVFIDREAGKVRYSWLAGDTDVPGKYDVEFRITWAGDVPETIPPDNNYLEVIIYDDLEA